MMFPVFTFTLLVILFRSAAFAQVTETGTQEATAESTDLAPQAVATVATVEIQYDGQSASGVIQMTTDNTSCTTSLLSGLQTTSTTSTSTITSESTAWTTSSVSSSPTTVWTSSTSALRLPPPFGITRSQMVNSTSTSSQYPTATGSSQMIAGTETQGLTEPTNSGPNPGLVTGAGTHTFVASSLVFWVAVTEMGSLIFLNWV